MLLEGGAVDSEGKHIEEVVASRTRICWDPIIANREKDSHRIDFLSDDTPSPFVFLS